MFVDHDDRVVEMTAATTRWMVGRKFCRLLSCLIRRGTEFSPILPVLALSPRHRRRALAQLAEQRSPKPQAAGSSPVTPATARQVPTDHPVAHPSDRHHEASEAQ